VSSVFLAAQAHLDQRGFQPGRPFAHLVGASLAGAFVVARAEACRGDQMPAVGKRLMSVPISEMMS